MKSMVDQVGQRSGFSNLLKEKVIVQQIWVGININNSWERLLIKAPHSLAAFEKLMMQAITAYYNDSVEEATKRQSTESRTINNASTGRHSPEYHSTVMKMRNIDLESLHSNTTATRMSGSSAKDHDVSTTPTCRTCSTSSRASSNIPHTGASSDVVRKNSGSSVSTIVSNSVLVKNHIVNAITEARNALESAHNTMNSIGKRTNDVPRTIGTVLSLIDQVGIQCEPEKIKNELSRLHDIVDDCAHEAFSLESLFQTAIKLADSKSATFGRSGFMLLGEVKHFWEKIVAFCGEISKLIEYTLDSSCNAFISIMLEQLEKLSSRAKYRIKDHARQEIYQISLACVAYALSVRHLTDAYSAFSNEFLMPQVNAISRYPLVANSEIELASAHNQFRKLNLECTKEIDRVVTTNRETCKRHSILELDYGLDLHLSDIAADLDEFLTPIADFKRRSSRKTSNEFDKEKQGNVFERFRSSLKMKRTK